MRLAYDGGAGCNGNLDAQIAVARLVVHGKPNDMNLPSDPAALAQCRPFAPVADSELVAPTIPNGTLTFAGEDPPNPPSLAGAQYTINNKTFLQQDPIRLTLGTAQQWTIKAVLKEGNDPVYGGHPFHIHVNPFQVLSYTAPDGVTTAMDVWRDTLFIPVGGSYTIRSRYRDLTGLSVLHCHILDHEDQGMMMPILLVNPNAAGTNGVDPSSPLRKDDHRAPALKLPDARGGAVNLEEFLGQQVVLVFFKGVRCGYCVADLRALVREALARTGDRVEIVAVSDRKVDDLPKALTLLGVTGTDKFHLLVDENQASFRDYGCGSGTDARHGLFLVDARGTIRWRYVGQTPFGNSDEVFQRIGLIAGPTTDRARTADNPTPKPATISQVPAGSVPICAGNPATCRQSLRPEGAIQVSRFQAEETEEKVGGPFRAPKHTGGTRSPSVTEFLQGSRSEVPDIRVAVGSAHFPQADKDCLAGPLQLYHRENSISTHEDIGILECHGQALRHCVIGVSDVP